MNEQKVYDFINEVLANDKAHPELRRFLENFSMLIEFGHFDGDEEESDDPFA